MLRGLLLAALLQHAAAELLGASVANDAAAELLRASVANDVTATTVPAPSREVRPRTRLRPQCTRPCSLLPFSLFLDATPHPPPCPMPAPGAAWLSLLCWKC